MKDLIIISGPTAVGKSKISIELSKKLNCEIISADSMQIYRYMDIGSAKIKRDEMEGIKHHLIDIINPDEGFSAAEYKKEATNIIKEIYMRGRLPLITGGTGLYIDSLLWDYSFADTEKDMEYRLYLQELADIKGKEYVHSLLKGVDDDSYLRLYSADLKRVIRALEVYKVTGKTISEFNKVNKKYNLEYNLHYFVLTMNREDLYNRINNRVDEMVDAGLIDEVANLKNLGYTTSMQSMKGIGYKEIFEYLQGDISLEDAVEKIKKGSRNYAKRQLTWFRKDKRIKWINKDEFQDDLEVVEFILKEIKKQIYKL